MTYFLLAYVFPWLVAIAYGVILLIFLLHIPRLFRFFRSLPPWVSMILIVFTLIGGIIRFTLVPNDHRIYFDEDRYLSYGVTFARFGKAVSVELATPTQSILGTPDEAARDTVPVASGITLRLFGFSETNLYRMAKIVSTITIPIMFGAAFLITQSAFVALFAAAGMALLPPNIYFSTSIGFDSFLVTFSLLTLLSTCLYAKKQSWTHAVLFVATIILLTCVRVEAIAFFPVLAIAFWCLRKKARQKLSTMDVVVGASSAVFLLTRMIVSLTLINKPWCCAEALPIEAFSIQYFFRNVAPNLLTYLWRPEVPAAITLLAIPAMFNPNNWKIKLLNVWIVLFFIMYSSYYAGNFYNREFSGSYGRYFLMQIPPLLMLSGLTLSRMMKQFKKSLIVFLLIIISLIPTILRYPIMTKTSPNDLLVEAGPRILHQFLDKEFIAGTTTDDVIIHNLTAPILLSGRTAVYSGYFYTKTDVQDFVAVAIQKGKNVYIDQTHRCDFYPDSCRSILTKFTFTPVANSQVHNVLMEMDKVGLLTESPTAKPRQ